MILKSKDKSNFSLKLKTQRWVQTCSILLPEEQSGLGVGCHLAGGQGWWQEGGCVRALVVLGKRHLSPSKLLISTQEASKPQGV